MNVNRNTGITLMGFLILLVVVGFFGYMAMRLLPAYTEYFGVVKSLDQMRKEPGVNTMALPQLRDMMITKFQVQYVDERNVPPQSITVKHEGGATTLRVAYERRVPFIYNIDFLIAFDKSANLSGAND